MSTDDATALESWLTTNEYTIPEGASDAFDPYVQGGSYFFVAKVKADEVTFRDGNAVLSPLRFYYDTPTFSLPIKLGLINAQGSQDLIVYTLGEEQRYEVANRPNVTIPTNIEVINEVRDDFGTFYRTLFAETVAQIQAQQSRNIPGRRLAATRAQALPWTKTTSLPLAVMLWVR